MTYDVYLAHHGILGMKWGVRRYQNADGTLTSAGRLRYNYNEAKRESREADRSADRAINKYARSQKWGRADEQKRDDAETKARQADRAEEKKNAAKAAYKVYKKTGIDSLAIMKNSKLTDQEGLVNNAKKMLKDNGFSDKEADKLSKRLFSALGKQVQVERSHILENDPVYKKKISEHNAKVSEIQNRLSEKAERLGMSGQDAAIFSDAYMHYFNESKLQPTEKERYRDIVEKGPVEYGLKRSAFKEFESSIKSHSLSGDKILEDVDDEVKRRLRKQLGN